MTRNLDAIFAELGLTQYLDSFVEQGFDSWDTILDIQESDLDALGVKLGHRRKLQRRIANARGLRPSISLAVPLKTSADDAKCDVKAEPIRSDGPVEGQGVTKRKYRRHPKPDENAPERPPSAYVLFSNKMREDLKSQNLTFTEIAKLVGENWQNLAPNEKEAYESQANSAKEKYHRDLVEYKKTPEYRKYSQYLQDFKDKQARQKQVQDAAKRPKMDVARLRHGSSSSSSATHGGATSSGSGTGSGSERLQGSEPPPTRRERMNSTTSMTESQHSSTAPANVLPNPLHDESMSPRGSMFERSSPGAPVRGHARTSSWRESGRGSDNGQHLPSLSDMLDDGKIPGPASGMTTDGNPYSGGFVAANHRRPVLDNPSFGRRTPLLRHEPSSNGSSASMSSAASYGRPMGEGPLPIHALLSNRTMASPVNGSSEPSPVSSFGGGMSPTDPAKASLGQPHGPRGYGFQASSSALQGMKTEHSADGDVVMTQADMPPMQHSNSERTSFDGMNALLTAGEIVSRHNRR